MNSISSKQFIGRILSDFSLEGTDFLSNIYQWIEDAIGIMEIPKYYVYKHQRKEVKGGKVLFPCDTQYISAIYTSYNLYINDNYLVPEYFINLRRLIIRNNPMLGAGVRFPQIENQYGIENGNYLNTSFDRGSVLFIYKGLPCDKEGYPIVPSDAKVIEALGFWIIYKLGIMGYKHPEVTWQDARILWKQEYPGAANSVNWFSPQEYQEFTEMWNNILIGDISNSIEM